MRLATEEEYKEFWYNAKCWYYSVYTIIDYQAIGTVAEYTANRKGISLYNQSIRRLS